MSVHHLTEADVQKRAGEHPCANCGAKAGIRCRVITRRDRGPGYPVRTKVHVLPNPHPERCTLAWREMLSDDAP